MSGSPCNYPGVLGVVSHLHAAEIRGAPLPAWPDGPEELLRRADHGAGLTFADANIRFAGQPIAAVIADTLANATAAAQALAVAYAAQPPLSALLVGARNDPAR